MIIIDRISDGIAVLETDTGMQPVAASLLPETAREGDVLCLTEEGVYLVDEAATEERRCQMRERLQKLKQRKGTNGS